MPVSVIVGIAFLVISLSLRRGTTNRHIRGRLLFSAGLFAAYTVAAFGLERLPLPADLQQQVRAIGPLLMAFGVINLVVALSLNPWRADRVPDRFPNIVQDTLVIALFAVAATWILKDRILATTAVGAVVIGFALQDTLGNLFAGLAIQIEKPFRVGDWVTIGGQDGLVREITWRATKIRTKAGNFVVVPNSTLAKDAITNFSEPTREVRLEVKVGVSYSVPPNVVKTVIREALRDMPANSRDREPEVLLQDFSDSAVAYLVRFWITDFGADERAKDQVRSRIYYAFRRTGLTIPFPIQVQMSTEDAGLVQPPVAVDPQTLFSIKIFAQLGEGERAELLRIARPVLYSAGEAIVRQGDPGHSLFVIARGEAAVTLAGTEGEVARLRAGEVFGEMSLLTGEPRNATVRADTDCELLEIDADGFRQLILADPGALERITSAVSARREELERHRDAHAVAATTSDADRSLLARVRQFLRLS